MRNQEVGQLHIPRTLNFAMIDVWIPGTGGFQMTVGKSPAIRDGADVDLADLQTKFTSSSRLITSILLQGKNLSMTSYNLLLLSLTLVWHKHKVFRKGCNFSTSISTN